MISHGDRSTEIYRQHPIADPMRQIVRGWRPGVVVSIRVLAVAGAVAAAMFTSAATVSASPATAATAADLAGTGTGVVQVMGEVVAPMVLPMETGPGEVPGMDMPGMDHGSGGAPVSPTQAPMPGDMPGMDHGSGGGTGSGGATVSPTQAPHSGEMPGMDMPGDAHERGDAKGSAARKPLVPVLGTFGGGTAAVMLTAGMMRRKDRDRLQIKEAARAARRSAK